MAAASDLGQVQRDRMVRAEHPAAAPQRVLTQFTGCLCLPPLDQSEGEGGRRPQGSGVVRAGHPAAAPQRVLTQFTGQRGLVLREQGKDEAGRHGEWDGDGPPAAAR